MTDDMRSFLSGCVFYPAAGIDGTPVRHLAKRWNRFVYADAWERRETQVGALHREPFVGYRVASQRPVSRQELVPHGWVPGPPAWLNRRDYLRNGPYGLDRPEGGWACLSRLQRWAERTSAHGPSGFELLQIQAEGAACYQALFNSNGVLPAVVVYIRAGEGFGGNYSDYSRVMLDVMSEHPLGLPPYLFCWHWRPGGSPAVGDQWADHYRELVLGPFGKDGEDDYEVSLFARIDLDPEDARRQLPDLLT